MGIVYEPKGRAKEYGELAVNLYSGVCPHLCHYCYASGALQMSREVWLSRPTTPRPNLIVTLTKDLTKLASADGGLFAEAKDSRQIFMCFTCDPYPAGIDTSLTRQAIETIHSFGFGVNLLSKGGVRAIRDLDLLGPADSFGATLTFLDDERSKEWEPGAALPQERMDALKLAHERGIPTWASLEPVIDPEASLAIIRRTHEYVDLVKVGTWNHDARAKAIDWAKFGREAMVLLDGLGKSYYIKLDLKARMSLPFPTQSKRTT